MKAEIKWRRHNRLKKMLTCLAVLTVLLFLIDITMDVFGNGYGLWGGPTRMFKPPSRQASKIMHKLLAFSSAQGGEWPEVNDMAVTIGFKNIEKINSKVCEAWLLEITASSNEQQYIYTDTAPHIRPFLHFEGERYLVVVCSDYGKWDNRLNCYSPNTNLPWRVRKKIPMEWTVLHTGWYYSVVMDSLPPVPFALLKEDNNANNFSESNNNYTVIYPAWIVPFVNKLYPNLDIPEERIADVPFERVVSESE